ncbi:MAG: 5'/3'-nucleotidase SurE [Natronomonas sp.]
MDILLTNDDGIDAVGLGVLAEALQEVGSVTVVAPADDQSSVGRQLSREVEVTERELGYAVSGTPADCVLVGVGGLSLDPDLVVAGCNRGANLGEYVLGRSGTVSAAVEAAFLGIPSIATSVYFPAGEFDFETLDPLPEHFREGVAATTYLARHAAESAIFETADYLNVNAPIPAECNGTMELTHPSRVYEMDAEHNGGTVSIFDRIWEHMATGDIADPQGSDRRAVVDGKISVSPLTVPHATQNNRPLAELVDRYEPTEPTDG